MHRDVLALTGHLVDVAVNAPDVHIAAVFACVKYNPAFRGGSDNPATMKRYHWDWSSFPLDESGMFVERRHDVIFGFVREFSLT